MCNKIGSEIDLRQNEKNKVSTIQWLPAWIMCSSFALTSCAVGPNFHPPKAPCTDTYTESKVPSKTEDSPGPGGEAQHFALGKDIPAEWWTLFHSKDLNGLIELGIANNPNLAAAKAALRQSQETMIAFIGTTFLPAVNGQFGGERERSNDSGIGAPNIPPSIFNLYNASVNVTYTLDVFGGGRRGLEALYAQVEYQQFLVEAAYLSLTANIVTTAVTEASLRAQLAATHELIQLNEKQLKIIKQQFELGGVSRADVLSQETQVAQVKATLPPLEQNLSVIRHALSVLVGFLPSDNLLPNFKLDNLKLPTKIPVSFPSNMVRQRPDIRASEALFHQASAQIGVATANMFPQFTLTGSYGGLSNSLGDLFKSSSNVWNVGGQILQPIFQGGSLLAKRRAAIAAYEQTAAQYRQTVLQGFQNVADTLQALGSDAETLKAQTLAERAAKASLDLVQKQYQLGAVNYTLLLNAEQQYQLARINRIKAQAARLSDTAALFQALGGGWWNRDKCN